VRTSSSGRRAQRLPITSIFGEEAAASLPSPHALQAFFGSSAHSGRNRFSGSGGEFVHEFLDRRVLDVQRGDLRSASAEVICT
jgi:hypothetical protein